LANRINSKIVSEYADLIKSLPVIIDAFDISITSLCEAVGISRQTFYNKMKARTFTAEEMGKICNYINR